MAEGLFNTLGRNSDAVGTCQRTSLSIIPGFNGNKAQARFVDVAYEMGNKRWKDHDHRLIKIIDFLIARIKPFEGNNTFAFGNIKKVERLCVRVVVVSTFSTGKDFASIDLEA